MHRVLKMVLQRLYRSSNRPVEGRWTCSPAGLGKSTRGRGAGALLHAAVGLASHGQRSLCRLCVRLWSTNT